MQKVPLNDKVVGFTKLNKTQRMIGLLCKGKGKVIPLQA
jgi:hypothetical protein